MQASLRFTLLEAIPKIPSVLCTDRVIVKIFPYLLIILKSASLASLCFTPWKPWSPPSNEKLSATEYLFDPVTRIGACIYIWPSRMQQINIGPSEESMSQHLNVYFNVPSRTLILYIVIFVNCVEFVLDNRFVFLFQVHVKRIKQTIF